MPTLIKIDTNPNFALKHYHYAINIIALTDIIAEPLQKELETLLINADKSFIFNFTNVKNISEVVVELFLNFEDALNNKNLFAVVYGCSPILEEIIDSYNLLQQLAPADTYHQAIEDIEADKASLHNDFDF